MNTYTETLQYLQSRIKNAPQVGIILGSGLGDLANQIQSPTVIPYAQIPNFCTSTAIGHKGNLIFGTLGGKSVVAMQGRFHYYEGYTMQQVTFPVRIMKLLGVQTLFVSNAAGAVNPQFRVGDLMVITDHINLQPNPLIGPNDDQFGVRFLDMTTTYSKRIRAIAIQQAQEMGLTLKQGVYLANTGPCYETPAEYKYYATIGADATGMSTIPEVIVAHHCGLEIFGMSVITNQANELSDNHLNDGDEVVAVANKASQHLTTLFARIIQQVDINQ
ncbi:MAG: purine nucleoside phosphorylase I, inosine and guanosine-specific [Bacteroidales bacterium]|nr:purine nucleoside phosphorylase I, inosine and guanosine-specific [Candidatus Colimorpha onthohippi]